MTPRALIEVILAVAILAAPVALLIHRTIAKKADGSNFGMGIRMAQFVGAATLPPMLTILALERLIDGCTVAALAGAFVGYMFSGVADFERRNKGAGDD